MHQAPSVLLLISSSCPHCASVLAVLTKLVKSEKIGALEIVNIQLHPERAQAWGVRSVPWVKVGPFELTGLRSQAELEKWIQGIEDPELIGDYFSELITSGEIDKVQALIEDNPNYLSNLMTLMADMDASLSVRIGVGAVMEGLSGSNIARDAIEELAQYTRHNEANVRIDACYYLGLIKSPESVKYIEALLDDEVSEVRDVAAEALDEFT